MIVVNIVWKDCRKYIRMEKVLDIIWCIDSVFLWLVVDRVLYFMKNNSLLNLYRENLVILV